MKDLDIVRGLKAHSSLCAGHCTLADCPYYGIEHCADQLCADASYRLEMLTEAYDKIMATDSDVARADAIPVADALKQMTTLENRALLMVMQEFSKYRNFYCENLCSHQDKCQNCPIPREP